MTKTIYNFDPQTSEYLNTSEAAESWLDKGLYLIPGNSTETPVIDEKDGCARVFKNDKWVYVEDHRGKTYWLADGSEHQVTDLGPLPDGALLEKPEIKYTAAQITAAVTAARAAAYAAEADPLFFKVQRGGATKEEWLAKLDEIKARYPDGVMPVYPTTT